MAEEVKLGSTKPMIATQAEMVEARVPIPYRDQCAHLLIPLNLCRAAEFYLPWRCELERHGYEKCECSGSARSRRRRRRSRSNPGAPRSPSSPPPLTPKKGFHKRHREQGMRAGILSWNSVYYSVTRRKDCKLVMQSRTSL
ncbi:NADH dehydrogenase (ubiquinone) 1 beta subcomplex subunit 7 [Ananas comosus]|uniref:NADH dehydrogenase [ubiquinone] 1 beta subcomplex subunit 7 n=1 Tax=Ananas comosus TaxID=4615 RepID=A0A199VB01_ANACO|nr:NADH dehydrogenase (ubiquinone) 1 beta subcomplex subunit 7 [Ananas comosus]